MKKTTYLLGLISGAAIAFNWRTIVKEGVKAGVKAGREIKKVSAQTLEDIQDAKAEAMDDLAKKDTVIAKAAKTA
jgi:hypothetical protein